MGLGEGQPLLRDVPPPFDHVGKIHADGVNLLSTGVGRPPIAQDVRFLCFYRMRLCRIHDPCVTPGDEFQTGRPASLIDPWTLVADPVRGYAMGSTSAAPRIRRRATGTKRAAPGIQGCDQMSASLCAAAFKCGVIGPGVGPRGVRPKRRL